jgi:hypothetical protein
MGVLGYCSEVIVMAARRVVSNVFKPHFKSKTVKVGDLVLSLDKTSLIGVTNENIETVTIPSYVTRIDDLVFNYCVCLKSITIPYSVTSIGKNAFYNCFSLTSIVIPDSVKIIGDFAFNGCKKITSITIPDSVKSIGDGVFYDCDGLTSITIPDSVTNIGDFAFYGCVGLTSITIPDSVTNIGGCSFVCDKVFHGCKGLTSITIRGIKYKTVMGDDGGLCVYNKSYKHAVDHEVFSKVKVYTGVRWFYGVVDGKIKLSDELVMVCDEFRSLHAHADTLEQAIEDLIRKYDTLKQKVSDLEVLTLDTIITEKKYMDYTGACSGGVDNFKKLYKERYKEDIKHKLTLRELLPLLKSIRNYNMPRLLCCMDDEAVKFWNELA